MSLPTWVSRKTFLAVWCHRQQGSWSIWPDELVQSPICDCYIHGSKSKIVSHSNDMEASERVDLDRSFHAGILEKTNKQTNPQNTPAHFLKKKQLKCLKNSFLKLQLKKKSLLQVVLWIRKLYFLIHIDLIERHICIFVYIMILKNNHLLY